MSTRLKFRVWNHGINAMFDVYGFNERQIQYRNEAGELGAFSITGQGKKKLTLLQFTGLKDKNGTEIYEEDKVKRRVQLVEGSDYMDYTCVIKWNGWCYALFIADKQCWSLDPITAREIEIIGNSFRATTN